MKGFMARKCVLENFWKKDVHRSSFRKGGVVKREICFEKYGRGEEI